MEKNQNGIIEGNTVNTCATKAPKEKAGLKGFIDGMHKKYDAIRYSKAGKWIMRGLTALTIGGVGKACYDKGVAKGKASVTPTVVTIEPMASEETAEAPAEEKEMEETV